MDGLHIDFTPVRAKMEGLDQVVLPKMVKIRQLYDSSRIEDVPTWLEKELEEKIQEPKCLKGKQICLTAGSRGIPFYAEIMKTLIKWLKKYGACPFIIPAMGSHAGGVAEGQKEMLATFGITEEAMGVPIRASMGTVKAGELESGIPIYCDKYAWESDGVIVINKIKPHTSFKGDYESGLMKMMAIGMAKHKGAARIHMEGYENFARLIPEIGHFCLEHEPILFGVGIVQNAYDDICNLEVIPKDEIPDREKELLQIAKDKLAKFKFGKTDVLIIDEIGKNIGGAGFDPNVVARRDRIYPGALVSQNIFVRGLTEETHCNASGIGTIEVTTLRCVRQIDWAITWTNMMTANFLPGCRIPCFAENDRQALYWAIRTCTGIDYSKAKIVRIKDTMHLFEIEVSENLAEKLKQREDIEILSEPEEIRFGEDGYIQE